LKRTEELAERITGVHESSLGLHPAVYFYATNARHQPTAVLAIAALLTELEKESLFNEFTRVRKEFEEFLISHKMFINQLTVQHGSMSKGFRPLKDYYRFVLNKHIDGADEAAIETALQNHDKYQRLVKEKPVLTSKPKKFSSDAKQFTVLTEILSSAPICEECGARIDLKATQVDHRKDRNKGGLGAGDNARLVHPYCNSTYKPYRQAHP
jgi:5-methylcytosine-specific restriction endonuclease McrA